MEVPAANTSETNSALSGALLFREVRRTDFIPSGESFAALVRTFLPFIYGAASRLLPDDSSAAERVVTATFETLALRRKTPPRRVLVAAWLLRTVNIAAARERKRLRLPRVAAGHELHAKLLKRLQKLPPKIQTPVLLIGVLGMTPEDAAQALRTKPARLQKRLATGRQTIEKKMRAKRLSIDTNALLAELPQQPPAGLEERLLEHFRNWSGQAHSSDLARGTVSSWRWVRFWRGLKTAGATLATIALLLACAAFSLQWLVMHGYLTAWWLRNHGDDIAKQIPELLDPARPWPVSGEDQALVAAIPPGTSGELYRPTNLWLAKLSFTPDDWKRITPSSIEPVRNMFGPDGHLILRNPKASRSGLAGVVGIEFNWTTGRLDFAGITFSNVAVRYRGNGTYLNSTYGPKQSFKVDLNKFGTKQNIARLDEINFLNSIADFSYVRDAMAQQLFRDLGVPGPRTAYAYLTLDVPGVFNNQPLGLYVLMENIDNDFASDRFGSKKTPIFKPVTPYLFKDLGDDWTAYEDIYDLKTTATPAQTKRIVEFAKLATHSDDAYFDRRLPEFLDLDAFASFLAGNVLLSSFDGFLSNGQNYYLYLHPDSNKFGFTPWDQDHSWGEFGYVGTAESREQASIWRPAQYKFHFLERVLNVPSFRVIYRKKLEEALEQNFTKEHLYPQIDQLAAVIRSAVQAENRFRYDRFEKSVSTNWLAGPRNGHPEGPKAPVHQIKRFIENRIASVRSQLAAETDNLD